MKPFLIVSGLIREAQLAGNDVEYVVSGADCALLRARLAEIDPSRYAGAISFGLAGALSAALQPGDLVIGRRALVLGAAYERHARFAAAIAARLNAAGVPFSEGDIAGVEKVLTAPRDKQLLRAKTRAIAVDMESHIVGEFADRACLPFAMVRAISDPADRVLPDLAANALDSDGRVRLGRVLLGLMRAPKQFGALRAAGRDSRAAFATLKSAGEAFSRI